MNYEKAIKNRDHLLAIGYVDIWLYEVPDNSELWSRVSEVEAGGSYRLNGPADAKFTAEISGLRFSWHVPFECRDASGRGVSLFERDRLREVARRLNPDARKQFAALLENRVLPALQKNTAEIRQALNKQLDSEDCVHGLIAFAREDARAPARCEWDLSSHQEPK